MIANRSYIYDPSVRSTDQRKKSLDYRNLAEQVDLEDVPQLIGRGMFYRSCNADSGIVQQSIEASSSQTFLDLVGSLSDGGRIGNVEVNGLKISLCFRPESFGIALPADCGEDTPPMLRQSESCRFPDPAGCSRNQYRST